MFFTYLTARQNGFEYKVKTQAKDYQNLKVDTLRVQNNRKLKSYTVEIFWVRFWGVPYQDLNPGPLDWQTETLPLSYRGGGIFRQKFNYKNARFSTSITFLYLNFCPEIPLPRQLSGRVSVYQSSGPGFKSRQGTPQNLTQKNSTVQDFNFLLF